MLHGQAEDDNENDVIMNLLPPGKVMESVSEEAFIIEVAQQRNLASTINLVRALLADKIENVSICITFNILKLFANICAHKVRWLGP